MELVVLQAGSFLKISRTLGFSHGMTQVLVVLQQLTQFRQLIPLRLPTLPKALELTGGLKARALQLNPFGFRSLLSRQQSQLHPA